MAENAALKDYLRARRSVGIAFLREPGPTEEQLNDMLTIAARVPDHGKFVPWRMVVFAGDARVRVGEKLAAIVKARNPAAEEAALELERRQLLPAPVTVGVIASPKPNPKAPELEQLLSAGNVCFNLVHAAYAFGFAASWVTRWFGLDPEAQQMLGARGGERFVGFIHIGTPAITPDERERPSLAGIVSQWEG